MASEHALHLLAYVHNNPVRAGLVGLPCETDWTSHRAYAGLASTPSWLCAARGLALSRFGHTKRERDRFDALVRARSGAPREPTLGEELTGRMRAKARAMTQAPVEIGSQFVSPETTLCEILYGGAHTPTCAYRGSCRSAIQLVAVQFGLTETQVLSRRSHGDAARARAVVLDVWRILKRPRIEMCVALSITPAAASQLVNHHIARAPDLESVAARLAERTRRLCESSKLKY